jgi:transcriptional regulator with XRE-family HTH domain
MARRRKGDLLGPYNIESRPIGTLGGRVREMRIQWEWTQHKLAETLTVSQGTIAKWEESKVEPSGTALTRLEAITGVSAHAWRTGEGWVLPNPPLNLHGHLVPDDLGLQVIGIPETGPGIWQIHLASEGDYTELSPEKAIQMVREITRQKGVLFLISSI